MSKVLHVSDDLHALIAEVSKRDGRSMKEWVNYVLTEYIHKGTRMPPRAVASSPQPVSRKRTEPSNGSDRTDGPSPWELPPFWQRRERDESDIGFKDQDQLEEDGSGPLEEVGGDGSGEPRAEGGDGASEGRRTFPGGEGSNEAA